MPAVSAVSTSSCSKHTADGRRASGEVVASGGALDLYEKGTRVAEPQTWIGRHRTLTLRVAISDGPARRAAGVLCVVVGCGQVSECPRVVLEENPIGGARMKRGTGCAHGWGGKCVQPGAAEGRRVGQATQLGAGFTAAVRVQRRADAVGGWREVVRGAEEVNADRVQGIAAGVRAGCESLGN